MTATDPAQIEFMQREEMPLSTDVSITYTEVSPQLRLGFNSLIDFISDVGPYQVRTLVEFNATADGVHMTVTFDAMHDEQWTERARAGHESELARLDRIFA